MPIYARVAVVLLVLLAGGYRIAQELRLFRCGCSCCLSEFLDCIRAVERRCIHSELNGRRHSPEGRRPGGAGVALHSAGEREKKGCPGHTGRKIR